MERPPNRPALAAILLLGAFALSAGGCAVRPFSGDAPADWAPSGAAVPPHGCPDLTGVYANRPADVHPPRTARSLPLHEVFGLEGQGVGVFSVRDDDHPWPTLKSAATVSFALDADSLRARFRDESAGEAVLEFHRVALFASDREWDAYYHCWDTEFGPALRFPGPRTAVGGVPGVYGELDLGIVSLFRGTDGALIVNYRTDRHRFTAPPHGTGGSQVRTIGSTWWRYPPAPRNP
jgi:hypothetical protein